MFSIANLPIQSERECIRWLVKKLSITRPKQLGKILMNHLKITLK